MILLKRIYKKAILILLPLALLSAFIEWKKLPMSILIGGILGLINLRGLARGVYSIVGTYRPTAKMIISTIFRLGFLAVVLIILFAYKVVNVFGILIGFTVVFILIITEGLRIAKEM
jgi:hypothetical protein